MTNKLKQHETPIHFVITIGGQTKNYAQAFGRSLFSNGCCDIKAFPLNHQIVKAVPI